MRKDDSDEKIYGFDPEKDAPLDDEEMGYAASLPWKAPRTSEHPTNAISDSHTLTSSWWIKEPAGGQA